MSKTVLVVEDDEDLQAMVVEILRARGYDVDAADNGAAALERVGARLPGLILLDMRMPVMNGWEFARVFRQRHNRGAPIVVFTAAADAHRAASEVEAEGCLNKPFEWDDLFAEVRRHIGEP
jgi:CheY-like chemotaxis protein